MVAEDDMLIDRNIEETKTFLRVLTLSLIHI